MKTPRHSSRFSCFATLLVWMLAAFASQRAAVAQEPAPPPTPKKIETAGQLLTRRVRQVDLFVMPQHPGYPLKNWHADKEMVAWATLNWKDVGEELPLMPFYDGNATYEVFLNSGHEPPNMLMQWQAQLEPAPADGGDGLFVDPAAEPDFIYKLSPPYYKKILHFDLGPDWADLPKTSTVRVSVLPADPNHSDQPDVGGAIWGVAKAVIHWHWAYEDAAGDDSLPSMNLAPGSLVTMAPVRDEAGTQSQPPPKPVEQVQIGDRVMWPGHPRPRTVIDKIVKADGSITLMLGLAAEDNDDDPAFDLTEQGYRIHDAYLDAQHTGAHHVKLGLEAYKGVAEFYATGPFYELGAAALGAAGTKSLELFKLALEEERVAQETGAMASEARAFAAKTRQAAHEAQDGEKAAELTLQAEKAEKEERQLEAGAQETRELAAHSKEVAEDTQIEVSCAEAVPGNGGLTSNCFVAGTLVQLMNGKTKPIELIKVGDLVLSRDPQTGRSEMKKVLRTFKHQSDEILTAKLVNGDSFKCTPEHPFFVKGQGFVPAKQLEKSSNIVTWNGSALSIRSYNLAHIPTTVYNFEVEGFHTYFIGKSSLWVHNTCGYAPGAAQSAFQNMRKGGGHAIKHLKDLGLVPKTGTLSSQVDAFKSLATPILENPTHTFEWAAGGPGGTACKAFVGYANGQRIVVFVAKEGPYQGNVLMAWEVTAANAIKYGI